MGLKQITRKRLLVITAAAIVIGAGGCSFWGSGDNDTITQGKIQKVKNSDAEAMTAEKSHFESSEDPPLTAQTHFAAGQLAEAQGNPAQAASQYREALKLDPKNQPALYQLAIVLTKSKQFGEAIKTWQQYVRATDGSAAAFSNLAYCYELSGQPGAAESAYQAGIDKDPNSQACRVNYGLMLARNDRESEAVEQLSAVLKPAEVQYNLASTYEQLGQKPQARAHYQKALELDPKLWEARQRLAKLD